MASLTRSTRRAEGPLAPRSGQPAASPYQRDEGRQKRGLEPPERDLDALRSKKARIAVEILARTAPADAPAAAGAGRARTPRPAPRHHQLPLVGVAGGGRPGLQLASAAAPSPQASDPGPAEHQAEAVNGGVEHEPGRLPPEPASTKKQGRKLRSQEATRFKSELSAYFPDYDEVIGNDPKEQHLFTPDTPIVVVDSRRQQGAAPAEPPRAAPEAHPPTTVKGYGDSLYTDVFDSQRIDFGFLETQQNSKNLEDPLPDGLFEPVHKKAERLERSIRNSEKGRAQHERDQIIRLLEGLQGHDWLRVMGVSGVTETRKRTFEPARAHFIKGCQAILDKFRNWSREEKRRKQSRERAQADQAAGDDRREGQTDGGRGPDPDARQEARRGARRDADEAASTASADDASEASSPAQQLRQEAMARSQMAPAGPGSRRPRAPAPPWPPEPPRAFRSFFGKRHERDGALSRNRRTGRKALAWGHAVPDMAEADFVLPEEYRDEDTLRARARKKRRDRRGRRP